MFIISHNWLGQTENSGSTAIAHAENLEECVTFAEKWTKLTPPPNAHSNFERLVAREIQHVNDWTVHGDKVAIGLVESKNGAWVIT